MGKFPKKVVGFIVSDVNFDDESKYDTEQDAIDSVDIEIEEFDRWQCIECDEIHDEREDAYSCCD